MPVQNDPTGDASLLTILQAYCKQDLHLFNRLDRPVSGLVLLTKSTKAQESLMSQQTQGTLKKIYLAVVERKDVPEQGILKDFLLKDGRRKKTHVIGQEEGQPAVLEYRVLLTLDRYLTLEVMLRSGQFHQIRAQLAHAGMPVKADVKYGARRGNPDRSIGLHAWKYQFNQPSTQEAMAMEAPIPLNDLWPIVQQKLQEHV